MKYLDMHCDTISGLCLDRKSGKEANLRKNGGHVDLLRMRQGECLGQNFAIFTNIKKEPDPYGFYQECLALYREELAANEDWIRPALSAGDLVKNEKEGRMSGILTIEDGGILHGSLERLEQAYEDGVRMVTLTWNYENELGYPNRMDLDTGKCSPETERGLKKQGFAFVERMEELGMAVDVSHLGDAGFWDVARAAKKPFCASHSNARSVASHVRNLTDEMIRAIAERGGVIGLNFCAAFLHDSQARAPYGGESRIEDMVRHVLHIRRVGGSECLGLGSDFDGIGGQLEVDSPAAFGRLEAALERAGFSAPEREGLFWKNVDRFYRDIFT